MSSSFLSALARAKERMECAGAQISLKLQMSLSSNPTVPCSTVTRCQSNVTMNHKPATDPQNELQKMNNSPRNSSTAHLIKYSDPLVSSSSIHSSTTPKMNKVNSKLQDYVISKSSEYKDPKQSLNTQGPTSDNARISLQIKLPSESCYASVLSSSNAPSATVVPCEKFDFLEAELSRTYNCSSPNCSLPSCTSSKSSYQPMQSESTVRCSNIENLISIREKVNAVEPAKNLNSTAYQPLDCVNIKSGVLKNSVSNTVFKSFPVSTLHSEVFPARTITTNAVMGLPLVSDVTAILPINKSEDNKLKLPNSIKSYNPKRTCIFCGERGHSSHNCHRFSNSSEFWNIIYEKRLCKNCLRPFHFSHKCYDQSFCHFRSCRRHDKHSPILCKHKYKSKFPSQYNSYEPSSENYQDICFNLNKSCSDKRFYSQGTQTNFVESKICQTQTLSYEEIAFYSKLFNSYFHESGTFDSE